MVSEVHYNSNVVCTRRGYYLQEMEAAGWLRGLVAWQRPWWPAGRLAAWSCCQKPITLQATT